MSQLAKQRLMTARKVHECGDCHGQIKARERYYVAVLQSDVTNYRLSQMRFNLKCAQRYGWVTGEGALNPACLSR